jgi:hypothetical protein
VPLGIFVFGRSRILKFADFPEGRHFSQPDSSSASELGANINNAGRISIKSKYGWNCLSFDIFSLIAYFIILVLRQSKEELLLTAKIIALCVL